MGLKFNDIVGTPPNYNADGLSGKFVDAGSTAVPANITFIKQVGLDLTNPAADFNTNEFV